MVSPVDYKAASEDEPPFFRAFLGPQMDIDLSAAQHAVHARNGDGHHRHGTHLSFTVNTLVSIVSLLTISLLFIFPSRYLYAIGLLPIFSFRWNDCIPKQSDSLAAPCVGKHWCGLTGLSPSVAPCSKGLGPHHHLPMSLPINYNSGVRGETPDFKIELIPLHSPLLGESLLVSFPPLTDMLKFSG
ncbi:hypothetical protein DI09_206p10 [Mitosporidium daphniae]|uniref:Uncharacterized protein n=1 Tax=Mitosporidium daphniae TaxID=1485682 RepID=A0A098VWJ3_9MICR|nr:hypothetical protein DI09_206p10 [Mitosporidium daphniae]